MAVRRALRGVAQVRARLVASPPRLARARVSGRRPSLHSQATVVAVPVGAVALWASGVDVRETRAYAALVTHVAMPVLRTALDPEKAHGFAVAAAAAGLAPVEPPATARALDNIAARFGGRTPPTVIGLAAGFDKQGEAVGGLLRAGFGSVEVGSITPLPQPGNDRPRMFRLPADAAVINRFGFNSDGLATVLERVSTYVAWRRGASLDAMHPRELLGEVGLNIGKNKEGDAVLDYVVGVAACAPFADYLVINVSSPNTPGLRALQAREQLMELVVAAKRVRDELPWGVAQPPWLADGDSATRAPRSGVPASGSDGVAGVGGADGTTVAAAVTFGGSRGVPSSALSGGPTTAPSTSWSGGSSGSGRPVPACTLSWTAERAAGRRRVQLLEPALPADVAPLAKELDGGWSEAVLRSRAWDARRRSTGDVATLALHLLTRGAAFDPATESALVNRWWRGVASRRLPPPLYVKIAPDVTDEQLADIVATAMAAKVDGLIISNTTVARPATLRSDAAVVAEAGGLSGAPLMERSTRVLAQVYQATGGKLPIIGEWGVRAVVAPSQRILRTRAPLRPRADRRRRRRHRQRR